MTRMRTTCGNCGGSGRIITWETVSLDEKNICTMKNKEIPCANCRGLGYTEYVAFSVEEAEVIMKHCGLTWED